MSMAYHEMEYYVCIMEGEVLWIINFFSGIWRNFSNLGLAIFLEE